MPRKYLEFPHLSRLREVDALLLKFLACSKRDHLLCQRTRLLVVWRQINPDSLCPTLVGHYHLPHRTAARSKLGPFCCARCMLIPGSGILSHPSDESTSEATHLLSPGCASDSRCVFRLQGYTHSLVLDSNVTYFRHEPRIRSHSSLMKLGLQC